MCHSNDENMKTEDGARKDLAALIESIDAEDLSRCMTGESSKVICAVSALLLSGMESGLFSSKREVALMVGVAFYLGRQAQKEDDAAEELLNDLNIP